ncbi:Cro/CI family transcriptional regulator, partial [Escherichia coli]|nr:Cro/CI family transcriptional regulator [Escherichia coli]
MLKTQVVEYYGGISKTAIALGVTHSAVCQWGNVIP